jgi:hypothetical protein
LRSAPDSGVRQGFLQTRVAIAMGSSTTSPPPEPGSRKISSVRPSKWAAAFTRLFRNDHAVVQLVTDDRLHIVGEIRHEEPVGSASWRHRLSSSVDRLGHEPVAVEVQLAASALQRERHGFRGGV